MNRPKTEAELTAHYQKAIQGVRGLVSHAGKELDEEGEKIFRVVFYLGWEACLSEVSDIRKLPAEHQTEQFRRLVRVCQEGIKV